MDIRYSAGPKDVRRYTTQELRDEFLITDLYEPDMVKATYSHVDRMVVMGIMPVKETVPIDKGIDVWANFGTNFFLERREAGVFNLGGKGFVQVDGTRYDLGYEDCLYLSKGAKEVSFGSLDGSNPSGENENAFVYDHPCGESDQANQRVINQFIHPDVLETCQLSMGLTQLSKGSVWNTMPSHTHERRMEVYTYFEIPQDQVVFHLMGRPEETRHLVMKNFDAVISPSWSIHSGCGTANYTFI